MYGDYCLALDNHDILRRESGDRSEIIPPTPLGIFAKGLDENLCRPWQLQEVGFEISSEKQKSLNNLFKLFTAPDLLYVIKVILSLCAMLFAFDIICGEKETGTLRQSLSYRLKRPILIIGKWIGGFTSFILPFFIAVLLGTIFVTLSPVVDINAQGIPLGDPRCTSSHLPLGRIATSDWSCCRVLDRMLLYERRIENSVHKTMRELERRQLIRQFQHQDAEQQYEPSPSPRDEAATRSNSPSATQPAEKKGDLKKQSQFVPGLIGAKSFVKGYYDKKPAGGTEENKAKQSQFQPPGHTKKAGKREKSPAAVDSLAG